MGAEPGEVVVVELVVSVPVSELLRVGVDEGGEDGGLSQRRSRQMTHAKVFPDTARHKEVVQWLQSAQL